MIAYDSTMQHVIDDYILCCQTEGKSPRTVRWYQQKLQYFVSYLLTHQLTSQVDRIGPGEIRRFIRHLQSEVKTGQTILEDRRRTKRCPRRRWLAMPGLCGPFSPGH